ncbi:hypothetical protein LSH36_492g02019 [Paralvinella palmiformis]|uniref:DNA-directed RNA polymerases I, II, and III subunit RPABC3 n=1 Tax=Paralvinella palmiformis TaxID=53620 RepID=A0AAD9J9T5_9ANNE|nr:hypothetical protein LSH36_492g02019 [Paralvinella palmiformis]
MIGFGDKFRMVIATSLREDGAPDDDEFDPTDTGPSRADSFDYVMYGKVYKITGDDSGAEPGSRLHKIALSISEHKTHQGKGLPMTKQIT